MHPRRLGNRSTAGLLLALLLAGLFANPSRAAAQRDNGPTSDTSYESPEFGYEVEWDDPWVADESETESSRDDDSRTLTSGGALLSILGLDDEGETPPTVHPTPEWIMERGWWRGVGAPLCARRRPATPCGMPDTSRAMGADGAACRPPAAST